MPTRHKGLRRGRCPRPRAARRQLDEPPRANRSRRSGSARSRRRAPARAGSSAAKHAVKPLTGEAGPRGDGDPGSLEHLVGLVPGRGSRRTGRRRSGTPDRSIRDARAACRPCARASSSRTSSSGNAAWASRRRTSAGVSTCLCPGSAATSTTSRSSPSSRLRAPRELDMTAMRRVERAAEETDSGIRRARTPRRRSRPSRRPSRRPRAVRARAPPRTAACRARGSRPRCAADASRAPSAAGR